VRWSRGVAHEPLVDVLFEDGDLFELGAAEAGVGHHFLVLGGHAAVDVLHVPVGMQCPSPIPISPRLQLCQQVRPRQHCAIITGIIIVRACVRACVRVLCRYDFCE
jgi:hypothetical protein